MFVKKFVTVAALFIVAGSASNAHAQWPPNEQNYTIQRLGFFGPAHTTGGGFQNSFADRFAAPGFIAGYSNRYIGSGGDSNGRDTWVYNPVTRSVVQTGLTGARNVGSAGYQYSVNNLLNAAGQVAGYSYNVSGVSAYNGRHTWVYNPVTGTTVQTGFTSAAHTGSAGFQYGENNFQNDAGHVAGFSYRLTSSVSPDNGRNTWAYNPVTSTTVQTGLTTAAHTGTAGYQYSENNFQNAAGQVAGFSYRSPSTSTNNGRNTWVYNPLTGSTVQTGFTGAGYTGVSGFAGLQLSENISQNAAGQVVGYSVPFTSAGAFNGQHSWIYNPATSNTMRIGLTSAAYTGSAGYQYSMSNFQNATGQVAGYSQRISGMNTDGDEDTWVYNPATNTTVRTGLTGAGYQRSENNFQNAAGQVAGYSLRSVSVGVQPAQNTWAYNPVTTTTVQTGLTGAAYTGSTGYQYSENSFQNEAGQVAGVSRRITGVNTVSAVNTWVYNPVTNTTVQTGLTGSAYTGSAGYQTSSNDFQNAAGQVVGYSQLITDVTTTRGSNTWVYNPVTNSTVQTGLTGAAYTGSFGNQRSVNVLQNAAGQVAGYSQRYSGASTDIGRSAWYFDPVTNLSSAIVGSIRIRDNYAFSQPILLTDDGFLLGYYSYFDGGVSNPVDRAFIFRPDLGLTDLGNLVAGGLTASGWTTLQRPQFSDALRTIVGYGNVDGQLTNRSVFVMTIPSPGAAVLLGASGLVASRRRR